LERGADVLGVAKEKLRLGLWGALPLPFGTISLVGLSSMVTSWSTFGGVTARAGVVCPNENGLLETSAAVLPLGVPPKLKAGVAAGAAVGVVGVPKVNPGAGRFSAVEDVPVKENPLDAGFSPVGAVLGRWSNENVVVDGWVLKGALGISIAGAGLVVAGAAVD
jgi:hypothetical protein